jgi:hypothetical protein
MTDLSLPTSLSHPDVSVTQATEERNGYDLAERLGGSAERGVLVEREMGPGAIVIVRVGPEDPAQMRFAQDQDVVQVFSPDRADQPLHMAVLWTEGLAVLRQPQSLAVLVAWTTGQQWRPNNVAMDVEVRL